MVKHFYEKRNICNWSVRYRLFETMAPHVVGCIDIRPFGAIEDEYPLETNLVKSLKCNPITGLVLIVAIRKSFGLQRVSSSLHYIG